MPHAELVNAFARRSRRYGWLLVPLILLCLAPPVLAEREFAIGLTGLQFDYTEYDDNNVFLDGEQGLLPGIVFELAARQKQTFSKASFSYYSGDVDYDGQTQGGVPAFTDTATRIWRVEATGGAWFRPEFGAPFSLYGGVGYHFWRRDIQSGQDINGNPVSGLLEEYEWLFLILGTEIRLLDGPDTRISLDGRLQHMLDATMYAYLGDGLDFDLGEKTGVRLSMPFSFRLSSHTRLQVEPYLSYWDLGRSNVLEVTVNGVPQGVFFLEPRSETRNSGLRVLVQSRF